MRSTGLLAAASALARGALDISARSASGRGVYSPEPDHTPKHLPRAARWGVVGKPRPASTYRANKPSAAKVKIRESGEPALLDRETYRSVVRSRSRFRFGRWPGVGDPRAVRAIEALRAQEEATRRAEEATATKPRRAPRKPRTAPIPAPA